MSYPTSLGFCCLCLVQPFSFSSASPSFAWLPLSSKPASGYLHLASTFPPLVAPFKGWHQHPAASNGGWWESGQQAVNWAGLISKVHSDDVISGHLVNHFRHTGLTQSHRDLRPTTVIQNKTLPARQISVSHLLCFQDLCTHYNLSRLLYKMKVSPLLPAAILPPAVIGDRFRKNSKFLEM